MAKLSLPRSALSGEEDIVRFSDHYGRAGT
jgi:hypothetical protein